MATSRKKKAASKKTSTGRKAERLREPDFRPALEKDWSTSLRGKSDPQPEGPDTGTGSPLWVLGRHAERNGIFRKQASVTAKFRERFLQELVTKPDSLRPLTEEEIAFCQGWLYLVLETPLDGSATKDEQILKAIKRHLNTRGEYGPVSG